MFKQRGTDPMERKWAAYLREMGYSPAGAASAAAKLTAMQPQWKEAYVRWMEGGPLPDVCVEGFDIMGLVEHRALTVPGAFLVMDWLAREPEAAKKALAEPPDEVAVSEELLKELDEAEEKDAPDGEDAEKEV